MGFVRVGTNQKRAFEIDIPRLTFLDPWQGDFQWVKAPYEVEVIYGPGAKFGCPFVFRAPPLSGRVIDSAQTKNCRLYVGMEQANYALLENGELWVWEKARYNLEYSKWPVIAAWFLGGSLGFVIGSVAVLMIRRLSRKGRRT